MHLVDSATFHTATVLQEQIVGDGGVEDGLEKPMRRASHRGEVSAAKSAYQASTGAIASLI
jgi:hypothetical protein